MQGVGWLCGTHCWACLGLDCHEFRMPLQLHALCAAPGKNCQSCRTRDKWWEAAGCVDCAAGPHRAVMGIKRRPVERPVEHACAKLLAPLATDYWAASHSFVEPGHSCFCSKFEKIVSVSEFLAGRMWDPPYPNFLRGSTDAGQKSGILQLPNGDPQMTFDLPNI